MSAPEPPVEPDPERPEPNDDEERGLKSGGYPEWDAPDDGAAEAREGLYTAWEIIG